MAKGGENLKLRLAGIDDSEIQQGFVICTKQAPVPCVKRFKAQLQVPACCCALRGGSSAVSAASAAMYMVAAVQKQSWALPPAPSR